MNLKEFLTIGSFVTILFIAGLFVGWLLSVGTIWLIQWLVNQIFHTSYNFNVWLGGLLFYLIWLLLFYKPSK